MSPPSTPISRPRAVLILSFILLSGLVSVGVIFLGGDTPVSSQQLDATAATIRQGPADAVVLVHPPWRQDLVKQLRARLPKRDLRLSPPVHQGRPAGSLIVVRAGGTPGPASLWGQPSRLMGEHGSLSLTLYDLPGVTATAVSSEADSLLLAKVKDLKVRIDFADRSLACDDYQVVGPRYACPGLNDWNYVGAATLKIGGQDRRCLWAHPITAGTLHISRTWPTGLRRLLIHHGLADSAASAPGGQSVVLRILADDQVLETLTQRNAPGYNQALVKLPQGLDPKILRIEIRTTQDGARHLCIDATSIEDTP